MNLPTIKVAGAILLKDNKFLILQRHPDKPEPLTWGLPSGKVDTGEDTVTAVKREVLEETSIDLSNAELFNIQFIYNKEYDFKSYIVDYYVYKVNVPNEVETKLEKGAHLMHKWVTPEECLSMDHLIKGLDDVIKTTFNII